MFMKTFLRKEPKIFLNIETPSQRMLSLEGGVDLCYSQLFPNY